MNAKVEEYLTERKRTSTGKLAEFWREFEELYQKKLWHRLTVKVQEAIKNEEFCKKENLPALYDRFLRDFEHRINQLALIEVGLEIARRMEDRTAGAKFLENLAGSVSKATSAPFLTEANVLCQVGIADLKLDVRDPKTLRCPVINEVRVTLEEAAKLMDSLSGVLPNVHGEYYRVSSKYLRDVGDYSGYYAEALRYLGCVDIDKMSASEQLEQAKCLGLAALLGEDVYNIGELLAHKILKALQGNDGWLLELLHTFNSGDLKRFETLRPTWSKQNDLKARSTLLERKIRLLCLMEMAFARPPKNRQISFAQIASTAKVDPNEVEALIMKAFSLGLAKGHIDEVEKTVLIHWVQPRVLDKDQINTMATRFQQWSEEVLGVQRLVEHQADEILIQ